MFDAAKVLIPFPQKLNDKKEDVVIGVSNKPYFALETDGGGLVFEEAVKLFRTKMTECALILGDSASPEYKIIFNIKVLEGDLKDKAEAYTLQIDDKSATVTASDEAGVFYGVATLVSLIHMDGNNVCLPMLDIADYPDFHERGQYLECRFGSDFLTLDDYKKAVDYFASLKQNTLTIGLYGCWETQYDMRRTENLYIPFKKYPNLKTPRDIKYYSVKERKWIIRENVLPEMFEKDYFADMVEYGLRKNVKIRPFFNSLGHNTLLPRMFPEISAKDEDGTPRAYGFCTRNEDTYKVMFDLYDEIIDRFIAPFGLDSIQIGLDEVWDSNGLYKHDMAKKVSPYCQCEKCRGAEHTELIIEYMINLCKYLKSRGMKSIYVFHDMLFNNGNLINEELKERFIKEDIYDVVVIDWWSYIKDKDKAFHGNLAAVNNVFRSVAKPMTGYYHWLMPTQVNENIKLLTLKAKELGFEGIGAYGSWDECYDKNYKYCADLSWNTSTADDEADFEERYLNGAFGTDANEAAKAMPKMNDIMFSDAGNHAITRTAGFYFYSYYDPEKPQPRNYPGEAFVIMKENLDEYKARYKEISALAQDALASFESMGKSHICDVWTLTAKQYKVTTDIFLALLELEEKSKSGKLSGEELTGTLSALIYEQESLMKMAEDVRIKANQYIFIRNLTLLRMALCDLLDYCSKELSAGRTPVINLNDLSYTRSNAYAYLV